MQLLLRVYIILTVTPGAPLDLPPQVLGVEAGRAYQADEPLLSVMQVPHAAVSFFVRRRAAVIKYIICTNTLQ